MALGRSIDRIERNIESIESKFAKFSNGQKIARMARILTIFGRNRPSRRNLSFQIFSNERKIMYRIDWIESYRSMAALSTGVNKTNSPSKNQHITNLEIFGVANSVFSFTDGIALPLRIPHGLLVIRASWKRGWDCSGRTKLPAMDL